MPRQEVTKFIFQGGYASDLSIASDRIGRASGYMRQGSKNALVTGAGLIIPFKGMTKVNGVVGSRLNFLTDDGYVGLGSAATPGFGTVFKAIDLLFFMGGGSLVVNGAQVTDGAMVPTNTLAGSTFQFLSRHAGAFDLGDNAHLFDVGHPAPSAPNLFLKTPVSPGQKPMNAVVSMAIWRADTMTGQPSQPSPSVQITVTNGSVIVQFPLADDNGQDVWGVGGTLLGVQIGNIYELPTSINGEVLETTLAYNRVIVAKASIANTTTALSLDPSTVVGDRFTSADIGRRVLIAGKLDSWITGISDAFNATTNDEATGTATNENMTVTHAVDGYTRAVEISWSDDDLLAVSQLAPYYAFTPMPGRFAGFLLDTFFIEDLTGTIFYSIPNYLEFPLRGRRIFTEDKAVVYLNTGRGYQWRIAKQSISRLYYSQGDVPIQLDIRSKNLGCDFPTNANLGYNGRLMLFSGRPTIVDVDGSFTSTLHTNVGQEFEGWENQTVDQPVVTDYDQIGQYDLWCYGNKIMAMHSPTGRWCAPIFIDEFVGGAGRKIVSSVVVDGQLRLVINNAGTLEHWKWNVGAGSDLRVVSYGRQTPGLTTVSQLCPVVRAGSTSLNFVYTVIADFKRSVEVGTDTVPANTTPTQVATSFRPDVRDANIIQIQIDVAGANGHAAIDFVDVFGEWSDQYANPRDY